MNSLSPVRFSLVLAALLAAGQAAHASVVFSNFGSPAQFDPNNGWGLDGGAIAGQMLAVQFTPASDDTLRAVNLALGIAFTNLGQSPITVYLAADAAGLPGADLADLTTLGTVGSFPPGGVVTYICQTCTALNSGTPYWVVAAIPNSDTDHFLSQASWNWNTTLDYSTGSNFAFNDTQGGAGWQYGDISELRPAFEVNPGPEPSSIFLFVPGAAALIWRRKKLCRSPLSPRHKI